MHYNCARSIGVICLALLLAVPGFLFGEDVPSAEQQAKFLLKALSYDKNLEERSPEGVHIAVLYKGEKASPEEIVEAFNAAGENWGSDLSVKAETVPFNSVQSLIKLIDEKGINAIYIDLSAKLAITSIHQVTRASKVPSLVGSKELVKQGSALGVYLLKGKPKIAINLRASKIEGINIKAEILKVSTVIK